MIDAVKISQELKDHFYYDPTSKTGLRWKYGNGTRMRANDVAGGNQAGGYFGVKFKARDYMVHRIIYELEIGELGPQDGVDHINGNRMDNRVENLRKANVSQNTRNQAKQPGKTSKYKGVTFCKKSSKWKTTVKAEGKSIHLGMYKDEASAALAYDYGAKFYAGEYAWLNFSNPIEELRK